MLRRNCLIASAAFAALVGCVTPGTQAQFQNSAVIGESEAQVWANLIGYFTSNNIPIKTIERDSGVIYAERSSFGGRIEPTLASCDQNAMLVVTNGSAAMNVFVQALSASQTRVTVNVTFQEVGAYGAQTYPITCYSTGALEAAVLGAAGAAVTVVPAAPPA
jgi:hypothetical protein